MNTPILTPAQAKEARNFTGFSQSRVAKETGVNRTKIALFEVEKYLLEEEILHTLRAFYEGQGFSFDQGYPDLPPEPKEVTDVRMGDAGPKPPEIRVDGFAMPSGTDSGEVEQALGEIQVNDQKIEKLSAEEFEESWWTDEPDIEKRDLILQLMARNYFLTRKLQGHDLFITGDGPSKQSNTNGALVQSVLSAV